MRWTIAVALLASVGCCYGARKADPPPAAAAPRPVAAVSGGAVPWAAGQSAAYQASDSGAIERMDVIKVEPAGDVRIRHTRIEKDGAESSCAVIFDGRFLAEVPPAETNTLRAELRLRVPHMDGTQVSRSDWVALRYINDAGGAGKQAIDFLKHGNLVSRPAVVALHPLGEDAPVFLLQLAARRALDTSGTDPAVAREDVSIGSQKYVAALRVEVEVRTGTSTRAAVVWAHASVPATGLLKSQAEGRTVEFRNAPQAAR